MKVVSKFALGSHNVSPDHFFPFFVHEQVFFSLYWRNIGPSKKNTPESQEMANFEHPHMYMHTPSEEEESQNSL